MKRVFTTAAVALFLLVATSVANAGDFGHFGHGSRGFGHVRIGNLGISFGGGGYGHGVRYAGPRYHHQRYYAPRRAVWHDTTHLDYHGPTIVRHRGHFDYIPGHYDVHRSGHYDYH